MNGENIEEIEFLDEKFDEESRKSSCNEKIVRKTFESESKESEILFKFFHAHD